MHLAGGLRGIFQPRRLIDRQGIHIRPQPDAAARGIGLALDHRHDAAFANASGDVGDPELAQLLFHKGRGLRQVELQLRYGVQMPPPCSDVSMGFGKTVLDRHGFLPGVRGQMLGPSLIGEPSEKRLNLNLVRS